MRCVSTACDEQNRRGFQSDIVRCDVAAVDTPILDLRST